MEEDVKAALVLLKQHRQAVQGAKGTQLDEAARRIGLRRWYPTGCSERHDDPESDDELRARALRVLGGA